MKVAVYGTLRKGGDLNGNMEAIKAKFIGTFKLKDHEMYNLGWFPAIVSKEGSEVVVESYEIDEEGLRRLDAVEGYPTLYNRKETEHGIVYFMEKERVKDKKKIESGDWFNK